MSGLSILSPASTYQDLLQLNAAGQGLQTYPVNVQDGLGNNTVMSLWTTGVNFDRSIGQFQLDGVALTASAATLNGLSNVANANYVLVSANSQLANASVLTSAAGITLVNSAPNYVITPSGELGGLQAITGTGLVVRTGAGTYVTETMTSDSTITITHPAGVGGAPNFVVNPNTVVQRINVQNNGVPESTEPTLNFIPGNNVGITVNDDPFNSRTNVIISAAALVGVDSITGTANQIIASSPTGNVTLSLAPSVIISTSVTAGDLEMVGNTLQATDTNGFVILSPQGTGAVSLVNSTLSGAVELQFVDQALSNYVAFKAANVLAGNTVWTLPTTDSTGTQALVSNGAGVLSWATGGGGVASIIGTANQITASSPTGNVTLSISNTYAGQTSITTLGTIGTGTWQGTVIAPTYGGTGVANTGTITVGGNTAFSGAFTFTGTLTGNTGVTFPTSGTLATTSQLPTPAALTEVNDTNVTLTLGGTPATALLQAVSITAGWTGTLSLARGGTAAALTASNGGIFYSTASAGAILAGTATANQVLLSGSSSAPAWSTATYPATTTINQLLYSSSANTIAGLATANSGTLVTSAAGVPSIQALTAGQILIGTTGAAPTSATLTAGSGVTITSASGSITINATGSGGTVTNVTGVSPIASTGGTTPAISLNGTATANQVLMSATATTTAYSTATYPATTTVNQLLYSSSANVIGGLATANSGVLITSAGGVPSIGTTLPTGVQTNITSLGTIGTGVWNGTVITGTYGGTGVNNGSSTFTIGGNTAFSGAYTFTGTLTANTAVTFPTSGTLATTSQLPTLPLSLANGGTNANLTASNGGIFYSTASAGAILAGTATANQILLSGASTAPAWSTATYPATTTVNQILYSSSANVIGGLATANSGTLVTSSAGIPSIVALGAQQSLVGISSGTPAVATLPGRNRVVNGDFQIWQRGAGGSASFSLATTVTQYTADRWQTYNGGTGTITVSQAAGPTSGSYYCRVQRNSGSTATGILEHTTSLTRDMCIGMAGNTLNFSFVAACGANFSAASSNLSIALYTGTGSTDVSNLTTGFTGSTVILSNTATLSTSPSTFSFQIAAVGSTVTQAAIAFYYAPTGTAGANDWFEVTNVQLEVSTNQTSFDQRNFGEELLQCQRFYCKSFPYGTAPVQNAGTGTGEKLWAASIVAAAAERGPTELFPVRMRAAPTITLYSPAAATAQAYDETAAAACTSTATSNITDRGFAVNCTGNASTVVGNYIGIHYQSDCDLT